MVEKLVVGPITKGLSKYLEPFNIDNDSFPVLINAYQWRGRIKRKRGTTRLVRLTRFFDSTSTAYTLTSTAAVDGGGNVNLLTGFGLQTNGNIVPGSVSIVGSVTGLTYTDPAKDGSLSPSGTINYATGAVVILAEAGGTITAHFLYYPDLPVMGLEDLILTPTQFPGTMAFDTTYSYVITTSIPYTVYDVSFYKNPAAFGSYVPKSVPTPTTWNGKDYQQFWTINYQGALWATNGVNVPFDKTNIGMQFAPAATITYVGNTATTITLTITNCPLVIGDFVFFNEWTTLVPANAQALNFQTGYVTAAAPNTPPLAAKTVTITLPNATLAAVAFTPGIVQYLTTRSDPTKDCIRWYDGDPTNGNATAPAFIQGHGWVNFCPPISVSNVSIADLPAAQYYLVGAKIMTQFKDRLVFFGPVVQTSSTTSQVYLEDVIIYSQNGTPYYTASFTGDPTLPTTAFNQLLVPDNQTATPGAYWSDVTGFGGFLATGVDNPIISQGPNEDVLIVGFSNIQTRMVYTGNDVIPFNLFVTNSELGSASTFSLIIMDQGVLTKGNRGYIISQQTGAQRFDIMIPDQVFEVALAFNGNERFTAQRDFINEWIYFTYPSTDNSVKFPSRTLFYNYREQSFAVFNECYTTYGQFRTVSGITWANVGTIYPIWEDWNDPWNSGQSTLLQPQIIAGNQQGYVLIRGDGTSEAPSLYIRSFLGNQITSPDHTLSNGDYIVISGCIGSIGAEVNNKIFSIYAVNQNTFRIDPPILGTGTYSGGGVITRYYVPFIQTRQFPSGWEMGRKTRIGPQRYLLSTTDLSQIQLLIYLSEDPDNAWNDSTIVPDVNSTNNSLIYSTVLYTCPESTNLGLTPANSNLNTPTATQQNQIWHRVNTSLIGDTIQFAFTMSDAQMRALQRTNNQSFTITGATNAYPCVLTTAAIYSPGQLVQISGVSGMIQLNGNVYSVISSGGGFLTINVDSTGFGVYTGPNTGIVFTVASLNPTAEIELHGFIVDISPSQMLC